MRPAPQHGPAQSRAVTGIGRDGALRRICIRGQQGNLAEVLVQVLGADLGRRLVEVPQRTSRRSGRTLPCPISSSLVVIVILPESWRGRRFGRPLEPTWRCAHRLSGAPACSIATSIPHPPYSVPHRRDAEVFAGGGRFLALDWWRRHRGIHARRAGIWGGAPGWCLGVVSRCCDLTPTRRLVIGKERATCPAGTRTSPAFFDRPSCPSAHTRPVKHG